MSARPDYPIPQTRSRRSLYAATMALIRFHCYAAMLIFLSVGCLRAPSDETADRVELVYWMSWTGFEVSRQGLELLNGGHKKFSPRRRLSENFLANHPHPYIEAFIDLCDSPNVIAAPRFDLFTELNDELGNAFDMIWLQQMGVTDAMRLAQERLQKKWDRIVRKKKRVGHWHPERVSHAPANPLLLHLADSRPPWVPSTPVGL